MVCLAVVSKGRSAPTISLVDTLPSVGRVTAYEKWTDITMLLKPPKRTGLDLSDHLNIKFVKLNGITFAPFTIALSAVSVCPGRRKCFVTLLCPSFQLLCEYL